jgi:hypothetical protein
MLKDVLDENFEDKGSLSPKESLSRGISLFREIPSTRSCRDADISEHYCPCYSSKHISTDDSRVVDSVGALLIQINDILNDVQTKCAKVVLFSITSASLVYADMQRDQEQERSLSVRSYMWTIKERTRLRIKFQTNPGNAVFESTVEYTDKDHINILGDINRINKYGNQSACIDDITLHNRIRRLYCYCV